MKKKVYLLEHLGCANCAAKIEQEIIRLPGVEEAVITFSTKQLRLTAEDPDSYIPKIQEIARSYESNITIVERKRRGSGTSLKHTEEDSQSLAQSQEHRDECCDHHEHSNCCEHDHEHSNCCEHHHEHSDCCEHYHEHSDCCEHHHEHSDYCEHHHEHSDCCGKHHEHHSYGDHPSDDTTKRKTNAWFRKHPDLIYIISGFLFFLLGQILPEHSMASIAVFVIAYLVLGGRIIKEACSNLAHGNLFDENFLMSIATLGAFAIQEYGEAVGVMLFFRIGEYFEQIAVEKSRSSIMEAIDMRPETVTLVTKNGTQRTDPEEIQPGDIILVRAGDRIPLDGTILEGSTRIDTSAVTGEPVPVTAAAGDAILSGCINLSGTIKVRVEKPLSESMVSRILDAVESAAANKPQMERFITRFSRVYTPFVVGAAVFTAIVPSLITQNWSYWCYTAITFLVISCPCALVLSVPLAFFSGIGAGSSKGILFKGGSSLESMEQIAAVVMDKTGTITEGTFQVREVTTLGNVSEEELLSLCASCEATSSHPIAGSILSCVKERNLSYEDADFIEEIAGKGIHAILKEEDLLCGNEAFMKEFQIPLPNCSSVSYGTKIFLAKNGTLMGTILIEDALKKDSKEAIEQLKKAGLTTLMLTGDQEENAKSIAAETGMDGYYANLLPEEKLSVLETIRKEYGPVMFVGDGINDAPVLAGADVGAAMGNGADAAIEAADVVFMKKNLSSIHDALAISKAATKVAKENIIFALLVKFCVILLGFLGIANMWFAVFADSGVAMICVLNSVRVLYQHRK